MLANLARFTTPEKLEGPKRGFPLLFYLHSKTRSFLTLPLSILSLTLILILYNSFTIFFFLSVIGAKKINVTLIITNKKCIKDDQSLWKRLEEAVTENT